MATKKVLWVFLSFVSFFLPLAAEEGLLKRYALILGSNNGGEERVILRYAEKDARAFSRVMQELGAVQPEDMVLLINPKAADVDAGFRRLADKIATDKDIGDRKELVVYYSGHSNEEGLLLFNENYPYKTLRDTIARMNVDVRVAILDSCSSGAFTRTKGGVRRPAFLVDASREMKGYAFLTSSSADEAAQESDRIEGSFFTHFLITGLRGAADMTEDRVVTLNEAYSYAFRETLARTERTQYGAQHPEYDIQLQGTGDLVLTDIRQTSAGLLFSNDLIGHLYIRDRYDNLVAELDKTKGRVVELGLEPGKYTILLEETTGGVYQHALELGYYEKISLDRGLFRPIQREAALARGDVELREEDQVPYFPVSLSLLPNLGFPGGDGASQVNFALHALLGNSYDVYGVEISGLGNYLRNQLTGLQLSGMGNWVGNDVIGSQMAGLFNYNAGNTLGLQVAGLVNITGKILIGSQISGIYNVAEDFSGYLQLSGMVNMAKDSFSGAQISGIANLTAMTMTGAQLSLIYNYAEKVVGTQLVGIVNKADKVIGAQVGLVNIGGEITGTQIGLVNLSEDYKAGLPLGLINIEKNGVNRLDLWREGTGNEHFSNVSVRYGTKYTYTVINGGLTTVQGEDPRMTMGAGVGIHIPKGMFFFNMDGISALVYDTPGEITEGISGHYQPQIRTMVGFELGRFGMFFGFNNKFYAPGCYVDPDFQTMADEVIKFGEWDFSLLPVPLWGFQF